MSHHNSVMLDVGPDINARQTAIFGSAILRVAGAWACVAFASMLCPAQAQFMAQSACAFTPEGDATNIRAVPAMCGSATFSVDQSQRQLGELRVAVSNSLYIRTVKLTYGSGAGRTTQQTELPMHRLLSAGEATDAFPTVRAGLGLQFVTVDASPPGHGADQVVLALESATEAPPELASSAITTASLLPRDWVIIGSTAARLDQLRDTIPIGRGKGRFESLMISSRGDDLPVQSVQVTPVNGKAFAVDLRAVIAPGTLSQSIAIDPPDFLHSVLVTYGTAVPNSRPTTLEVRGRYSENWLGKAGENRHFAGGWVLLGTADIVVRPHGGARDSFRVEGQPGPFKKLRFVARRGSISLASVAIDAGDGRTETLPVNATLVQDKETPPFVIAAGSLPIISVALTPHLKSTSRLDASVEVWAQY